MQADANPVSLKVLRLCKPSLHFAMHVSFLHCAPVDDEPQPGVALSGMLTLPQSFGDIYLGETFSCYISLCNVAPVELAHVGLKVEVQTQLQRETLADSSVSEASIGRFVAGKMGQMLGTARASAVGTGAYAGAVADVAAVCATPQIRAGADARPHHRIRSEGRGGPHSDLLGPLHGCLGRAQVLSQVLQVPGE